MAGTPNIKVFDHNGVYQAACKEIACAAILVEFYGKGSTIRFGHSKADIVWTEGQEGQPATESYDHVAEVTAAKWRERNMKALKKAGYTDRAIEEMMARA